MLAGHERSEATGPAEETSEGDGGRRAEAVLCGVKHVEAQAPARPGTRHTGEREVRDARHSVQSARSAV